MGALEEVMGRMMAQVRTTSQVSEANKTTYKCEACRDSGWIQTDERYKPCNCVEIRRLKGLWENFGIKPEEAKKLNEYVPFDETTKTARDKAVEFIKSFDEIKNHRENGFGLFGQPGSGKTHIIVAIGAALLNRKDNPIPVVYMPYLEVMRELKANTMDDEDYNRVLWKYQRAKVLIIDDLFKDKVKNGKLIVDKYGNTAALNEADLKHIYPILNYRYLNFLPTLISTECKPQMLVELDEALAGRIIESCGDNMTVFGEAKYNYRLRKYMK